MYSKDGRIMDVILKSKINVPEYFLCLLGDLLGNKGYEVHEIFEVMEAVLNDVATKALENFISTVLKEGEIDSLKSLEDNVPNDLLFDLENDGSVTKDDILEE